MLRFPIPSPRLKFSRLQYTDLQHSKSVFESFPIHSVHLLIPNSSACVENYENLLASDESIYFEVRDVPASFFIENTFLESFVRSGLLLGVTSNTSIQVENFLSVVPPGKLVLSLERSIALSLALDKENSKQKLFQTIIIDLTCPELSPQKEHYRSISFELSKIDHIKFTVLLKWQPKGNVCSQSLKSYCSSQGFKCVTCKPKPKYSSKFSIPVPKISFEMWDADILNDILEWIGMQLCGLQYSVDEDEYTSKLTAPESFECVNRLYKCSFEGFYTQVEILPAIQKISKMFENDPSLPFITMCISGFQDSYIQGNGFQFYSSDDKLICIIIFPSCKYWLLTLNCR